MGGPKEAQEFEELMQHVEKENLPVYNKLGKTTLREMAALLGECEVVVACDTGALHMAVALQRPVCFIWPYKPRRVGTSDWNL